VKGHSNMGSVLALEGWLEFNRYKWGVTPLKVWLTEDDKDIPAIEAILYLDKKGCIVQPPLNPYLPVIFYPTPTHKRSRLYRQWLSLSKLLVEEFRKRRVRGSVAFPPEVVDVRQWQWNGFTAEVRYTFHIELPHKTEMIDYSDRKQIDKALRSGFRCEIADKDSYADVVTCLWETEARQKFRYRLAPRDLEVGASLLGRDVFRIYVCRSNSGEVVSARIVIALPETYAMDWVAGTKNHFLSSGATQLLIWHILEDLAKYGARGFDFCGANLPTVSAAKSDWGGNLVPYFVVRPLNFRTIVGYTIRLLKQKMSKKAKENEFNNFN